MHTPQALDRFWHEHQAPANRRRVEGTTRGVELLAVDALEFDIGDAAPRRLLTREREHLVHEIGRDHPAAGGHARRDRNCRLACAARDIQHIHSGP